MVPRDRGIEVVVDVVVAREVQERAAVRLIRGAGLASSAAYEITARTRAVVPPRHESVAERR